MICYARYLLYLCAALVCWGCRDDGKQQPFSEPAQSDTARVMLLIREGNRLAWSDHDSVRGLLQQALRMSKEMNYVRGVTSSLMALGTLYITLGEYNRGLVLFEEGLNYARSRNFGDSNVIQQLYANIAGALAYSGNYKEAAEYCYKALDIASRQHAYASVALISNNIGSILSELGDMERGVYYFSKSKEIAYRYPSARKLLPILYCNEGELWLRKGNLDYSMEQCRRALDLAPTYGATDIQYDAMNILGNIYALRGNNEEAIHSFLKVLNMKENYPLGKIRARISLGRIYTAQGLYTQAERQLKAVLGQATILNLKQELVSVHKELYQLYRTSGQLKRALVHNDHYMLLQDSIINVEKMYAVRLLETKYQTARKDKEIAENKLFIAGQRAQIIRKNTLLISISTGGIILLVGLLLWYRHRKRLERQQQELAVWKAASEGEERERVRIARDLHDGVGGLLSSLRMHFGVIEKRNPAIAHEAIFSETLQLLDLTADEIRKTAHNLMPEFLLRHGLTEAIRTYCHSVQNEENLSIDFQYYGYIGELNHGFQLSVYRIVQELIQNIIKHADASFALVQLSCYNDVLDITIEDNGKGFLWSRRSDKDSIGLQSIRSRIAELNGHFQINSSPDNGTTAYIEFYLKRQRYKPTKRIFTIPFLRKKYNR